MLVACSVESAAPVEPTSPLLQPQAGKPAAGELILRYTAGASAGDKARARGLAAATVRDVIPTIDGRDMEVVVVPPGLALATAAAALSADPSVDLAEPNLTYQHQGFPADASPDDPSFGQLWGLHNEGQLVNATVAERMSVGTPDVDLDAPEAWAAIAAAPVAPTTVYIGVIDEGIDHTHSDLTGIVGNPNEICGNGIDDDGNGYVDDCYGWDFVRNDRTVYDGTPAKPADAHGTHVAGTIAARANNAVGVTGIAHNVRLLSGKFLGATSGSTANAIKAVNYFTTLKRRGLPVVATNNSWGGGGFSVALYDAIRVAGADGILFVVAAGNSTKDNDATPSYPCSYGRAQTTTTYTKGKITTTSYPALGNIVCVAAHDQYGKLATFSNWGRETVHVAAPGTNILSTTPNNTYSFYRGTSMATPHVSGVVALLASQGWDAADIRARILGSVVTDEALATQVMTGGRANAHAALLYTAPGI